MLGRGERHGSILRWARCRMRDSIMSEGSGRQALRAHSSAKAQKGRTSRFRRSFLGLDAGGTLHAEQAGDDGDETSESGQAPGESGGPQGVP